MGILITTAHSVAAANAAESALTGQSKALDGVDARLLLRLGRSLIIQGRASQITALANAATSRGWPVTRCRTVPTLAECVASGVDPEVAYIAGALAALQNPNLFTTALADLLPDDE